MEHTDGYPPANPEFVKAYQEAQARKAVLIPAHETRGYLAYTVGDEIQVFAGWISMHQDGGFISARKIGGRNTWHITNMENVLSFKASIVAGGR